GGRRRNPALLGARLEAEPPAVESRGEHRALAADDPAIGIATPVGVGHRDDAHAAVEAAALRQLGHDVPRLPLPALRIREDTIAHRDPPPLRGSSPMPTAAPANPRMFRAGSTIGATDILSRPGGGRKNVGTTTALCSPP